MIEVDPWVRKQLLAKGRIYIEFASCRDEDHIRVLRCYKCQKYGHDHKNCQSEETCGRCSGAHETRSCKAEDTDIKCVTCAKVSLGNTCHLASSNLCPFYARQVKSLLSNIDYGH